jgi:hypothetical protein
MNLTKDRFSSWEDKTDKDYEPKYDDELIINIKEGESSRDMADYILGMQDEIIQLRKLLSVFENES